VLGPLLFILYINDITEDIQNAQYFIFVAYLLLLVWCIAVDDIFNNVNLIIVDDTM
jgi:hypothetical protein